MDTLGQLAQALAKAQGQITAATMDGDNPFFKSRYATLDAVWNACRKPLSDNELAVVQLPSMDGNNVTLETRLIHSSGEFIATTMTAPTGQAKNPVQGMGSTITYLRRYALAAIVGVTADEDDDGNSSTAANPAKPAKPSQPKEAVTSWDTLLPVINRATGDYFKNVHHLKNGVKKVYPNFETPAPDAVGGWREAYAAAKKHAELSREVEAGDPEQMLIDAAAQPSHYANE